MQNATNVAANFAGEAIAIQEQPLHMLYLILLPHTMD